MAETNKFSYLILGFGLGTSETARGERLRSLSALLPQGTGAVSENVEQLVL